MPETIIFFFLSICVRVGGTSNQKTMIVIQPHFSINTWSRLDVELRIMKKTQFCQKCCLVDPFSQKEKRFWQTSLPILHAFDERYHCIHCLPLNVGAVTWRVPDRIRRWDAQWHGPHANACHRPWRVFYQSFPSSSACCSLFHWHFACTRLQLLSPFFFSLFNLQLVIR